MTEGAGSINLSLESLKGFLGKIVQYVLGFIGTIVFARILGPTSFGGFYFLLSLVYIVDNPLRGLSNALEKRVSETDSSQEEIVGGILLLHLIVYIVLAIALATFGGLLIRKTNVENAPVVFFLLFTSSNLFLVFQHILSGNGYPSLQIWNDTLRSIITTPLQLLFVLIGLGAAGMGYGLTVASFLTIPIAYYFVPIRPELPSQKTIRDVWQYAKYSVPGAIVNTAYSRLDILLIATILSTGAAGQYETAYKLTLPATLLSSAIAPALMPKVSNAHSKGSEVAEEISNAVAFTSALAIPIFFGVLSIPSDLIVTVYGGEYSEAASLLIGLAMYQILNTQVTVYGRTINAIDLPDQNLRVSMLSLSINVVLGVALVLSFGAFGIVLATVIAEFCRYLMYVFVVYKNVPTVTVLPRPLFEQIAAGVLMFTVVETASTQIVVHGWVDLLFLVGIGGFVYSLVLVVISTDLRITLRSVWEDVLL